MGLGLPGENRCETGGRRQLRGDLQRGQEAERDRDETQTERIGLRALPLMLSSQPSSQAAGSTSSLESCRPQPPRGSPSFSLEREVKQGGEGLLGSGVQATTTGREDTRAGSDPNALCQGERPLAANGSDVIRLDKGMSP